MPILLSLLSNKAFWLAIFIAGALAFAGFWKWRYEAVRQEFDLFQAQVKATGLEAEKQAKLTEIRQIKEKEQADEEHKQSLDTLHHELDGMRKSHSGSGGLSAIKTDPGSPETACFDAAKLDRALRRLDEGIQGITGTGQEAVIGLDTAKVWANQP